MVKAISACISEDGDVQDSASDELRAARGKLRGVENRLKALLKGHSGEVSEMVRSKFVTALCPELGKRSVEWFVACLYKLCSITRPTMHYVQ